MKVQAINQGAKCYIEALPGELLSGEKDTLDLVSVCAETGTDLLMIHADALSPAFFHLSNGLAGAVLLKFSNYSIRTVFVVPPELEGTGKFHEMALELNRGREFHIARTRADAEAWLLKL
jgi:hypothetical protein